MAFLLKGKGRAPAQIAYPTHTEPLPLLEGVQSDEPYVSYHSVHTAFPDAYNSDVDIQHFDFPLRESGDADHIESSSIGTTSQDSELALSVSYLPEAQLLSRILGNGSTFELRWLGRVNPCSRKVINDNELVIRINFPRTLRNISASKCLHLNPATGDVTVVLLDQQNGIYRMQFPNPLQELENGYMFRPDRYAMSRGAVEAVHGLPQSRHSGNTRTIIWSVYSDDEVVIGLDGSILRCLWHGQDWSFYPITNAPKPRIGRGWRFNSEPHSALASETIALTTFTPKGSSTAFAYTLSRDRTLRSFNLTDLCPVGKVIDVHQGIEHLTREASDTAIEVKPAGNSIAVDDSVPQVPLLQILPASNDDWHFIFVLSPTPKGLDGGAILRTYTAQLQKNDIINISGVGYISCSEETLEAQFRGFAVETAPGLASLKKPLTDSSNTEHALDEAVWRIWTAWDLGGSTLVEWSSLTNMLRPGSPAADGQSSSSAVALVPGRPVANPWKKVHELSHLLEPEAVFDSTYIDELIDANNFDPETPSDDIKRLMLSFIFCPGRFSQHTIASTLTEYHSGLPKNKQDASYLRDPDIAIDVKVAEIVGCAIQLEEDDESGLPRLAEFRNDLKREYLGFWASLQAQERQSRWPLLLAPASCQTLECGTIVIGREGVSVAVRDDEVTLMSRLLDHAEIDETQQTAAELEDLLEVGKAPLEPFLPQIAEPHQRSDIAAALKAAGVVAKTMTVYDRDALQTKLLDDLAPLLAGYSVDDAVAIILADNGFDNQVTLELRTNVIGAFADASSAIKTIESCIDVLSQSTTAQSKRRLTYHGISLAVSASSLALNVRSKVLFELLLTTLVLRQAALDAEGEEDIPSVREHWFAVIARLAAVLHRTLVARWLCKWRSDGTRKLRGARVAEEELEVFVNLFQLSEEHSQALDSQTYYSMFHTLLTGLEIGVDILDEATDLSNEALSEGAIRSTPIVRYSNDLQASAKDVVLARRLFKMGLTEYAKALTTFWPVQHGMTYIRASALVLAGQSEEAAQLYLSLTNVIAANDRTEIEQTGLADAIPASVMLGGLSAYYRHVMDIFEGYGYVQQATRFAELAIRNSTSTDSTTEDLHKKIFRAYIAMGRYEEAYATMITNPFADFAPDAAGTERPLGDLIHAMCHDNQIQALLSLPFIGLESQVEQELTFRARNSDPMSTPNYYQILFAWHIMKTDYRQAGVIMYLQGRRIAEHLALSDHRRHSDPGEDYGNYLAKQAQSYLAVIQAFSLIDSKNQWFTVPTAQSTPFLRAQKRRRVSSLIPSTEYSSRAKDLEIVTLADVRKEYSAVVALLMVVRRVGGELNPDTPLSLEDCIRYLCRDGLYEEAFLSAASYGFDMSEIFASLTERCLLLTPLYGDDVDETAFAWLETSPVSSKWVGTLAERSWRYLQHMLRIHRPSTSPAGTYYQTVLQTILELNRDFPLPIWLLEWAISDKSGGFDTLIREALRWGLVVESVEWSRAYIMKTQTDLPVTLSSGALQPVFTPFTMFDQVVAAVKNLPSGTTSEKELKEGAERSVEMLKRELERKMAMSDRA